MLLVESEIVRDRINGMAVTQAILIQNAIASVISEEGGKAFTEIVEQLSDGG